MEKDKKEEKRVETPKLRQIIIETDGNDIKIAKAEVNGKIELVGILRTVIEFINNN